MENKDLILIELLCSHHNIELSFIHSLSEIGLVEIIVFNDNSYLAQDKLYEVEKMIRWHYELEINIEGIDVIYNLLTKINNLQQELTTTQNKLKIYDLD